MKNKLNIFILIGLVLGILGGIFLPDFMNNISFIGTIYVNLLKFIIIPIIFTNIMVTIYNSRKEKNKILSKTLITFILMFVTSFLITSLIVLLIKPGNIENLKFIKWDGDITKFSISEIIVNMFPVNLATMIESNAMFPCIIFSVACGFAAAKAKNGKKAIEVVDSFKNIFNEVVKYIMYLTPVAILSLIGTTIANYGSIIFGVIIKYILTAYICSIVVAILVMIIPVWIITKMNPFTYIKKVCKVWLMTLTTCSSQATLPVTIKTCNEELDIPEDVTNIVVPLGCTIHMCGGAVSFALLGIFCSQLFNVDINFLTFIIMIISATLINMAAPGIPNGGIVIGASYLAILGIPLTFIGVYSGIYKLLDMSYTTLNVFGDISANMIINKWIKKKKIK